LLQKKKGVKKQGLTASYKKSYQQVFCLFSLFSSDGFKGLGHASFFMYICPFFSFFYNLMIGAFFIGISFIQPI